MEVTETALDTRVGLHPRFVLRVAGEPTASVVRLSNGAAASSFDALVCREKRLRHWAHEVCGALERALTKIEDRKLVHRLLELKRDVYNIRRPRDDLAPKLQPYLFLNDYEALCGIVGEIESYVQTREALLDLYAQDEVRSTEALAEAFETSLNVRSAIRYTNSALYCDLCRLYRGQAKGLSQKKRRALENTFLQYLLRGSMKTSPRSSFTLIGIGEWSREDSNLAALAFERWDLRIEASLRQGTLLRLLEPLWLDLEALPEQQELLLNPTLSVVADSVVFSRVFSDDSTASFVRGTCLSRMTVKLNVLLRHVLELCTQAQPARVSLARLVEQLQSVVPEQAAKEVPAFIARLLRYQLLSPDMGFEEQGDALSWAHAVIGKLRGEPAQACHAALGRVREALLGYAEASAEERSAAAKVVHNGLEEIGKITGEKLIEDPSVPMMYEDCYFGPRPLRVNPAALGAIRDDLELLLQLCPLFDQNTRVQCFVADRFIEQFGPTGICPVPIDFLSAIHDQLGPHWAQSERWKNRLALPKPLGSGPLIRALDALLFEFYDHVLALGRAGDRQPIAIDRDFVRGLVKRIPLEISRRALSQCFIGQLLLANGAPPAFVVNHIYTGHSKLFARFLRSTGEPPRDVREYLAKLSREGKFAEVPGVFGFNVNRHPPLGEAEILIAPFAPNLRGSQKIDLRQCTLDYERWTHTVRIRSGFGERVDAFYLGSMNFNQLPAVQRMLDVMSSQGSDSFDLVLAIAQSAAAARERVFCFDRVSMGALVLARRTVHIPNALLPDAETSDAHFFFGVQQWYRSMQLPREVYVRLAPSYFQGSPTSKGAAQDTSKWKPLYVDFSNPLLVRLLRKAIRLSPFAAEISESLPTVGQTCVSVGGQSHMSEIQIELSRFPSQPAEYDKSSRS